MYLTSFRASAFASRREWRSMSASVESDQLTCRAEEGPQFALHDRASGEGRQAARGRAATGRA